MDAQRIAVDAVVALTDCDRDVVTAFIRRLYLAGVKDPKRLTFKGLQAIARGLTDNAPLREQLSRGRDRFEETVDLGLQAGGGVGQLFGRRQQLA